MTEAGPQTTPAGRRDVPTSARARRLDLIDRLAARLISLGGVAIVLSVVAIVLFVGAGAIPLLRDAVVDRRGSVPAPLPNETLHEIVDEYLENIGVVNDRGLLLQAAVAADVRVITVDTLVAEDRLTAATTDLHDRFLVVGDTAGVATMFEIDWRVTYREDGRTSRLEVSLPRRVPLFDSGDAVSDLAVAVTESGRQVAVSRARSGALAVYDYDPEWEEEHLASLPWPEGRRRGIRSLALSSDGTLAAAGAADGAVVVYDLSDPSQPRIQQILDTGDDAVTTVGFLLGGVSLIVGREQGTVSRWLPVRHPGRTERSYRPIDEFTPHHAAVTGLAVSRRGKSFVTVDASGRWMLHHATTGKTNFRLEAPVGGVRRIAFSPKADAIVALQDDGGTAIWNLDDPHPEVTLHTLFGKVWYEGYDQPEYVWQSTGGTDEFEPKLSLIPLIFGTLKGTFYAMLFSVPVALLAAIYVSQLARSRFRATVKPVIELMAAIPSVVVGFLAALWLAPMIEAHLVGTALALVAIPIAAVVAAVGWRALPLSWRLRVPEGWEPAISLPFILGAVWLAFVIAPTVESWLFAGDVRQWLFATQDIRFDPRNNIVVGFALGIAVIPIIFTVSEDALSNVPRSLVSGALALGASPWQATWRIVLRAASPGIFAAIMLGFGRAVGETMIVLMATGNTPIMDWSIFNGMRTMSAAIAVEIPEAPAGGTLYRVLFLTAFLLFVFTLLVNTLAAGVGTRLRKRFGRF